MKIKRSSIICLMLSAVLIIGAIFTSCDNGKKGSTTVDYLEKIIEKTFGAEMPEPENTYTEIVFRPTSSMPIAGLDSVKVSSYAGTSAESVILAEATYKGEKTDLSIYSGGKSYIIGSSILGNEKYGFMAEDLEALMSFIYGDQEQDYEYGAPDPDDGTIPPSSGATGIVSAIDGVISLLEGEYGEKILLLSEKYLDIFVEAAEKATENKVAIAEDITVTVKFNTDCAKKMIKDVFSAVKKDKELKSFITDLLVSTGLEEAVAKAQIDAFLGSDDLLNLIYDGLDSVPFSLAVVVKADLEYNMTGLSVALNVSDGTKIKTFFDISDINNIEFGYSTEYFDYDLGELVNDEMRIIVSSSTEGNDVALDMSMVVLSFGYEQTLGLYSLSYNVESGAYTLSSELIGSYLTLAEDMPFIMSGVITAEDKKTTVTVTEIKAADVTYVTDITVTEETGVTLPQFPTDYKGMLDITDEDVNAIKNAVLENQLFADIAELVRSEDFTDDFFGHPEDDEDYGDVDIDDFALDF